MTVRTVAVTGAGGFIGRHVLAELAKHTVDVVAMVQSREQAEEIGSAVRTVVLDIETPVEHAFGLLGRPDALIHLAWGGLPNYRSLHHVEVELPLHYGFLSGLVRSGLECLVVSGTCLEYGMRYGPLHEALAPLPNNPYACAKDTLRRQLEFLRTFQPFSLTWARLFYLYGDGQAPTSLLSQLRMAVDAGDAAFNMSGGEQLRDYLHVSEVAAALVELALKGRDNGIVNICSGSPISVRSLVERWIHEHQWTIGLNLGYYPYPDYEPMAFWGDRSKLARCLELH